MIIKLNAILITVFYLKVYEREIFSFLKINAAFADEVLHFLVGAFIVYLLKYLSFRKLTTFYVLMAVACGKEAIDFMSYGHFCMQDLMFTLLPLALEILNNKRAASRRLRSL